MGQKYRSNNCKPITILLSRKKMRSRRDGEKQMENQAAALQLSISAAVRGERRGKKGKIIKILKKRKTKNQVTNALSTDRFDSLPCEVSAKRGE